MAGSAADKLLLGTQGRKLATDYKRLYNRTRLFVETYFDGAYGVGGANEILDADLTEAGITASELAGLITFLQQLDNLWDNAAVAQGDYSASVNAVANVQF